MKVKINEIVSKFATVIVAALIGWTACADITVQKKRKDQIYNDEQVVVDVSGDGVVMNTNTVREIVQPMIESHHDNTKLDKSGGTMTGDLVIDDGSGNGITIKADGSEINAGAYMATFTEVDSQTGFVSSAAPFDMWYEYGWRSLPTYIASLEWRRPELSYTLEQYGITDGATKTELAGKRDLTDNKCHKTEFTEWTNNVDSRWTLEWTMFVADVPAWYIFKDGVLYNAQKSIFTPAQNENATSITWEGGVDWAENEDITFTRSCIAVSNETFVTTSYVTNAVATAKYVPRATDPTFTNAVLQTVIPSLSTNITAEVYIAATNACANLGIDPSLIPQGGTLGTVGGLLIALAAAVALLRKKTALLESDGKASNTFATDLLGKPAAKTALMIPLETVEAGTSTITAEDGHAYAVTMTGTVTITMPTTTAGKAAIFQARFSAAAQQSVQFDTDDVVKFDGADCGIVKAGKDALLSAMWNGSAWDLVWKNEA